MTASKRVAIVGSGCSGIGALWALKNTNHEVYLYEAASRLGGHSNTVTFEHNGKKTNVDTGFICLNTATYPNFIAFLKKLNIPTVPTEMTFGVSRDQGQFEWAGTSLSAVFAQKSNFFCSRTWRMIFDVIRFNQFALDILVGEEEIEENPSGANGTRSTLRVSPPRSESIGDYLQREGYSDTFRDDYLIPMTAAVWSTSPDKCSLDFPAITLIRFMWNHHLLTTVGTRPTWMTIPGGSQQYIDAVMAGVSKDHIYLNTAIKSLDIAPSGQIKLCREDGQIDTYDHVILATHGDQATDIIREIATPNEIAIMSSFQTNKNTVVLHSDLSLMPKRPIAWSAWNYITTSSPDSISSVCLTYNMNILQHIPRSIYGDVLVTLNPLHPPAPYLTQGTYAYSHPLYTPDAIRAQSLLSTIQNTRGISYCGAWTKYGFHEDGFTSGVKVAVEHLGGSVGWDGGLVDSTFSRGKRPVLGWGDWRVRLFVYLVQFLLWIVGMGFNRIWIRDAKRGGRVKVT